MQPSVLTEVFLPLALAFIMLGMGLTLTVEDFRRVVVYPKAVAIGLVAQVVLLPLLGWVLLHALGLPFGLGAGLMILALCPGGPTASLITFLAKGDAALSVTLTATSSVITLATTPIGLSLALAALGGTSSAVTLPVGQTFAFLLLITIVPVLLGMAVRARKPAIAAASETPFKIFGLVFLLLIIAAAMIKEKDNLAGYFAQAGIAALLLNVLALAMGAGLALLFRLSKPQAACIAIDTGNCNGTLSVAIAATILRQPEMAVLPAVYSLIMLVLGAAAVFVVPRMGRRLVPSRSLGARSVGDLLRRAAKEFGPQTAMMVPVGREYRAVTYTELLDEAHAYASALRSLGLKRGDRFAILAENSGAWGMADWGAQTLGLVTVPIFPTLTSDVVEHTIRDSEASLVLTGSAELERKVAGLDGVRVLRLAGPDSLESLAASTPRIPLAEWHAGMDEAEPEDLSTLIYTSGTTGMPKGVMLPNRVFTHVCDAVRRHLQLDRNEVFLSFLPMSHVYERVAGQVLPVSLGATIVYSRGLASLAGEMRDHKPTIMLCVPRFLEATMERIVDNAHKLPRFDRWLFEKAVEQGKRKAHGQFAPWFGILDVLVLSTVRDRLGGNFRFFVSGGAALPPHVGEFYSAIGLMVLQGYGLTETGGATAVNLPQTNKYWTVGEPIDAEVKLAADGEILVRGPSLMQGYYKLAEATGQAIDSDGWFHTGDIGEWEGKSLKITDRKKDLFKLSNGKYVAPQPLENKLKECSLVMEAVVFGDGQDMVTALIVPDWEEVRERLHVNGTAEADLVSRDDVRALVKSEVDQVNRTLPPHEIVKKFVLLERAFSIEAGELTPTLKVKRKAVAEKYGPLLLR